MPESNASDNAPAVRAEVSPTTAKLGDVVTLDIHVDHPLVLSVETPAFAKELGAFEVRTSTHLPVEIQTDKGIDHFRVELQAFTTGQLKLPGLDVPYRNAMGKVSTIRTPELVVTIEEIPPGSNDKGDIRGIIGALGPVAWSPWWIVFGIGIAIALGIGAWYKRKRLIEGPPPPPPIPADVEALQKLRALAASNLLASGKIKEFYSAISDTVRAYVERGFHVPALERTTGELMRDLRRRQGIASERQAELKELLETCDLAKFAKFRPTAEEGQTDLETAIRFVENTRSFLSHGERLGEGSR